MGSCVSSYVRRRSQEASKRYGEIFSFGEGSLNSCSSFFLRTLVLSQSFCLYPRYIPPIPRMVQEKMRLLLLARVSTVIVPVGTISMQFHVPEANKIFLSKLANVSSIGHKTERQCYNFRLHFLIYTLAVRRISFKSLFCQGPIPIR